jgi:hypothetical protein
MYSSFWNGMKSSANCSEWGNGRGLRITELIRLKTAVFIPIPKPRIKTAVMANPGDLSKSRIV